MQQQNNQQNTTISKTRQPRLPPPKPFTPEWFFLNYIAEWKPEHIRKAILYDIDLYDLLVNNEEEAQRFLGLKPKDITKEQVNAVSIEDILLWFAERRPDLYAVILESAEGIEWLRKNMENIKKIL